MERDPADSLGNQGEHDEAAIAVRELLARFELAGKAVEHSQELFGRCQLVHRHGHEVVVDVGLGVLVEVVTDAGSMRQQVFDGDAVPDKPQIATQNRRAPASKAPATRRRSRLTTATAVMPFTALAMANWVSIALGTCSATCAMP